ncbi:nuclear GTP-binding protein [Enteropsectra breve]|nr:nuclear GTP-binding protein [Enteropsectra breve]
MKGNFYNTKKIKYINMLNSGKAKKNSKGNIVKDAVFQSKESTLVHIESKRNLFNNTKVITQNELEAFRNTMKVKNSYDVLLSTGNVPYSMINNDIKIKKKYDLRDCFGSGTKSKRPKLQYASLEEMKAFKAPEAKPEQKEDEYCMGQSRRVWNELYKVLDSSDVVVHVLDARDPLGTKCNKIEEYINTQAKHKHLIYVLNKVDLVPTSVTAKWLRIFSKEHPAIAYHSNSLENNYGKNNLINIMRQLKTLYKKQSMSVGFVGYPNIGKSSIINTLRDKNVCKSAPVPGETKVWQYITLMKDLYLIDSPGVVPIPDYKKAVLRGAIRIEKLEAPEEYVPDVIEKATKPIFEKTYGIEFSDMEDMYLKMAKKYGKLVKGGEPNVDIISKNILHDWLRGKIPYFVQPPEEQ